MTLTLILSLLASVAVAEDAPACDAKALSAEMAEASPLQAAEVFQKLAACDPAKAKAAAKTALPTFLGGPEGNGAMVAAIQVGAPNPAIAWIDGLQSDERAKAIGALGEACPESTAIQGFFVNRASSMGADFWEQRWYRALAACPVPAVQELLAAELDRGMGADRSRFFAVLDTYARGSGGQAIPRLKGLLSGTQDAEAQGRIVASFAAAARVGSVEGTDTGAAAAAVAALIELSPGLQTKAIDQARLTLQALGAEQAADELAKTRYQDKVGKDGSILWGAVVLEDATCKNGKRYQRVHVAEVTEPGRTWADQLKEKVAASAGVSFELDLAAKCKGEGTQAVMVPSAPFADRAAFKAWAAETVESLKADDVQKFIRMDHDALAL